MDNSVKDLFSAHSDLYAKYRPLYPKELYEFIIDKVAAKDFALDCGTGNGQAARVLANHFTEVHATDISAKQISNSVQRNNLQYHVCTAEQTPFPDNTFDLVTCATAVHWFDFDKFFKEVTRVAKNDSIFACWAYSVVRTDNSNINALIDKFYSETVYKYWDPERRHVDEQYKSIPFPFKEINNPGFATELHWDLDTLFGYLNTWSAVQRYIRENKVNPVSELMDRIKSEFKGNDALGVTFPIFMRIGTIRK